MQDDCQADLESVLYSPHGYKVGHSAKRLVNTNYKTDKRDRCAYVQRKKYLESDTNALQFTADCFKPASQQGALLNIDLHS